MATKAKPEFWKQSPEGPVHETSRGDIACCDALDFLRCLRTKCADIVFLDPPFNLGKQYGKSNSKRDQLGEREYVRYILSIIDESIRVLKDGAALYMYHIPRMACRFSSYMSDYLEFRHWIAIAMKNGFVRPKHLYPAHYALLYFTKGKPKNFTRPKIPLQRCRSCGETVKDYGGYKRYVKDGVNLSDVWDDLSPVRHGSKKSREANEMASEIPERALAISGRPRGLLVDPFAGSGTALLAAIRQGMHFAACDREPAYCELMHTRVEDHLSRRVGEKSGA